MTDLDDPRVVEALTRKCSMCQAGKGVLCVCLHKDHNLLSDCPTATPRHVHLARLLPTPKGGD